MSEIRAEIYNNLATLTDAGVPILRALNIASLGLRTRLATALPKLAAKWYAKTSYFTIVAYTSMKVLTLYSAI